MRKTALFAAILGLVGATPMAAQATNPKTDLENFQNYFLERFPDTPFEDFQNGVYAVNPARRQEWKAMEEFPPYEIGIDIGKRIFHEKMPDGSTMEACFPNYKQGIRQNYPHWDDSKGELVTLEGQINACREKHGAESLGWAKGKIAAVTAYLAYMSRGNEIDVEIPNDSGAMAAYERGKEHFFMKRGQLNFACADCHMWQSGSRARGNVLSPALGHLTHFPVYRKKWEARGDGPLAGFGTPHRRYGGCNRRVRAADFPAQSDEYKALEYFEMYMSNGLEINGPGVRE